MDYSYTFSDFTDDYSNLKIVNYHDNKEYTSQVKLDDTGLTNTTTGYLRSIMADLVDIAGATFISDWLLPRKLDENYNIHVILPIRNPQFFSQPWVLEELKCLLQWYTDDTWYFEFRLRNSTKRKSEQSPKIPYPNYESVEIALWSGGLDSLAGLCGRIVTRSHNRYVLLGSGSNTQIQGVQSEIKAGLQNKGIKNVQLIQLPIQLSYCNDKPRTNDIFRARGFTFKLLGTICALLECQQVLHVYENGYGAINLPFTMADKGIRHTRSVHPISLLKMSEFISKIIEKPFRYHNPYLFMTKAQMCSSIIQYSDLAYRTITCDSRYRQSNLPSQCGYCSSCLLRRMALLIVLGEDKTEYVATYTGDDPPLLHREYFGAMDFQADRLRQIFCSPEPWQDLSICYPSLRLLSVQLAKHGKLTREEVQENLIRLYKAHVVEWLETRNKLAV